MMDVDCRPSERGLGPMAHTIELHTQLVCIYISIYGKREMTEKGKSRFVRCLFTTTLPPLLERARALYTILRVPNDTRGRAGFIQGPSIKDLGCLVPDEDLRASMTSFPLSFGTDYFERCSLFPFRRFS